MAQQLIKSRKAMHKTLNWLKRHRQWHLPMVLFLVSALVHFANVGYPNSVVFDEVHFGKYVTAYCCSGENFFDIHPPHAKLLIAGTARLFGYQGGQAFEHIGETYHASPVALRLLPAFAGALLPVILFILLRQLGASTVAALFGAGLVLLDNAIILQSRVVALDCILLVAIFGCLVCFIHALRAPQQAQAYYWMLAAGALAGLACGTKFTGLVSVALPGVIMLVVMCQYVLRHRQRSANETGLEQAQIFPTTLSLGAALQLRILQGLTFLASVFVVYVIGWYLHFALLPHSGPGDVWLVPTGNFIADTITLHQKMLAANHGLTASHPDASPWWSWPFMSKPLYYWEQGGSVLYLLGNPILWWGAIGLFLFILINSLLMRVTQLRLLPRNHQAGVYLWVPVVGYAFAFVPFMTIPRPLFLYHYFTPLLFSMILVVLWLDYAGWIRGDRGFKQRWSVYAVAGLAIAGFVAMSPLTYAMHPDLQQWSKTVFWWWFK